MILLRSMEISGNRKQDRVWHTLHGLPSSIPYSRLTRKGSGKPQDDCLNNIQKVGANRQVSLLMKITETQWEAKEVSLPAKRFRLRSMNTTRPHEHRMSLSAFLPISHITRLISYLLPLDYTATSPVRRMTCPQDLKGTFIGCGRSCKVSPLSRDKTPPMLQRCYRYLGRERISSNLR